jgi:hypothetical protein
MRSGVRPLVRTRVPLVAGCVSASLWPQLRDGGGVTTGAHTPVRGEEAAVAVEHARAVARSVFANRLRRLETLGLASRSDRQDPHPAYHLGRAQPTRPTPGSIGAPATELDDHLACFARKRPLFQGDHDTVAA